MLNLVVCIKQVPGVSELPWDSRTGTLKREMAEGMINPACKHALEAALQLKQAYGGKLVVVTMGPPMAEEVLYEARAMGADGGVLLSDRAMAGADTSVTSFTLAKAIAMKCPDFDLVLCGCSTSDSETAQVGPQLAEELDIPGIANVHHMELAGNILRSQRFSDNFLETLEMDLPGLVTVSTQGYQPRYVPLAGLQISFEVGEMNRLGAQDLGLDPETLGSAASPTKILNVYSPTSKKDNVVMKGSPKKIVEELFARFDDKIGGVIGKDLKVEK
ncbi:MAG: electron transfer flavoprotein subunit beta/FixA family protein [Desulfobacterales bacterium]